MSTTTPTPEETTDPSDLEWRDRYMREIADHKRLVGKYMQYVIAALTQRAINHDLSKFAPFEFEGYLPAYPIFCQADYNDDTYREAIRIAKPAVDHHVEGNRHHPEYFDKVHGVDQMNLIDLLEMVCDWVAASMRNGREDDFSSLKLPPNFNRFKIDPQLAGIIQNTVAAIETGEGLI